MKSSGNHVICTLFDHNYLPRGRCMIASARRQGFAGDIWVLCLSEECRQAMTMLALDSVHCITLGQLEEHVPRMIEAKNNRSILEYYFTCMAALHTYLFDTLPDVDGTMYVDADIKFFASPWVVFDAIGDAPVAVTPHNFVPHMRHLEMYGDFNGGWSAFRRTHEGQACLKWWLEQSLEWCFNRVEGWRYANQKYMNRFPDIAHGTRILRQKGFNCAPWNIGNFKLTEREGRLWVDDEPLVFYHFHGLRRRSVCFEFPHNVYATPVSWLVRNKLYRPYIAELVRFERQQKAAVSIAGLPASTASPRRAWPLELRRILGKVLRSPRQVIGIAAEMTCNLPIIVLGSHIL
jgi:hypothetical protein